jgi:hypothetical protein
MEYNLGFDLIQMLAKGKWLKRTQRLAASELSGYWISGIA